MAQTHGRSPHLVKAVGESVRNANPAAGANPAITALAVAEVASYIAQLSAEMATMAAAAKLEVLAYFLAMARREAETIARGESSD